MKYDNSIPNDLPERGLALLMPRESALASYRIFNPDNKDPSDNALLAIALNEKLALVTSDPKILTVTEPGLKLIDAAN